MGTARFAPHLTATKTALYKLVEETVPGILPPCKYCDFMKSRGAYSYWLRSYDISAHFTTVAGVPMLVVFLDGGNTVKSLCLDIEALHTKGMVVI